MLEKRSIKNVHIYVLKDPETLEVRYVGKTKLSLEKRLKCHLNLKTKDYRGCWFQSLKNKELIPSIESIEKVSDETWSEREMYWIQYYKKLGAKLVNGNDGGLGGHNPTAEVRAKMSAAQKGKIISAETRAKLSTANKNRSPEISAKISAAAKNRSSEARAKVSAAHKGRKHSAEARAKMSAAHKNRSAETCAKMAAANKGQRRSAEACARMSAAAKGRIISAETRAKISSANKGKSKSAEAVAKRLATLKAFHKKNKIPFNQRKSLVVDNSNLAFKPRF